MLQFSNSNRVMEPETISKNGASLKSQMSRRNNKMQQLSAKETDAKLKNKMKKLVFMTLIVLMAMSFATSCSKDEKDTNDLVGTSWIDENDDYKQVISFDSENTFKATYTDYYDDSKQTQRGTYIYKKPNITLTIIDGGEEFIIRGTINGNTLKLTNEDDETYIFFKQ